MISYMKKLNLPIAANDVWDEENFDFQILFNLFPVLAFDLFFDLKLGQGKSYYYAQKINSWKHNNYTFDDSLNIMKNLKVADNTIRKVVADFDLFFKKQKYSRKQSLE